MQFVEAISMGKELTEMTLEDLWELFPIFLVALKKETGEKTFFVSSFVDKCKEESR